MKMRWMIVGAGVAVGFGQPATAPVDEGQKIIGEAFAKLSGALGEAIAKEGAAKALGVCSEQAPRIAVEVGKAHGVTLRRASAKPRNPKNAAAGIELGALEEFAAALAKGEAPQAKSVTHADGSRDFLAPIVIGMPLCLQCHGEPGRDVAKETLEAIREHYPEDRATGYQAGELRGLWRVTFPAGD